MPRISVIMAAYNAENTIREAVDSILNQTYTDFELLINDGGSTDKTIDIIKSYSDDRVILMHQKEAGLPAARNEPIAVAKGEYIAIMDADDISLPERFAKQVAYLDENQDCGAVGSSYKIFSSDPEYKSQVVPGLRHEKLTCKNDLFWRTRPFIGHPTAMLRKESLDKITVDGKIYRMQFANGEDCDMFIRLAEYTYFYNLPELCLHYRVSANSAHHNDVAKSFLYAFVASVNYYQRKTGQKETIFLDIMEALKQIKRKYRFYHPIWIYLVYGNFDLNGHYKIFGKWPRSFMKRHQKYMEMKYK